MEQLELYRYLKDIPFGEAKAISKAELKRKWGMDERKVRHIISQIREEFVICAYSSGSGYFRPETRAEIEHYVNEMKNRARNTFAAIKTAEDAIKRFDQGPQLLLEF